MLLIIKYNIKRSKFVLKKYVYEFVWPSDIVVEMQHIVKKFGDFKANDDKRNL